MGTTTYQYDLDGNLIATTDPGNNTTDYTFNDLNQLTAVNGPGLSASYFYDPLGNQVSQTVNGTTTNFQFDPIGLGNVVASFSGTGVYNNSGGLLAHYTYGLGLTSQVGTSGTAGYYDFGLTGNTVGITNPAGSYVNRYSYLPFGQTTILSGAVPNHFTFVGWLGVQSDGSGMFDMRARNYNPQIGQFVTNDPLGIGGGAVNIRLYVRNDPLSHSDPSGRDPLTGGFGAFLLYLFMTLQKVDPDKVTPFTPEQQELIIELAEADNFVAEVTKDVIEQARELEPLLEAGDPLPPAPTLPVPPLVVDGGAGAGAYAAVGVGGFLLGYGIGHYVILPLLPKDFQDGTALYKLWLALQEAAKPIERLIPFLFPADPNNLVGPAGFGTQSWVTPQQTLPYSIEFENDPKKANVAAQDVTVTEQLDPNLDWSTFELGSIQFGAITISVPAGLQSYTASVDTTNVDGTPLQVNVSASLDQQTGLVTWTFLSLDPATGLLPTDPVAGFLPVDDSTGRGEAFLNYTVRPKASDSTGTQLNARATVVFDTNAPLSTNTASNTIDAGAPTSTVGPLPPTETSTPLHRRAGPARTTLGGSGIGSYNIYVSDNGGPVQPS